MGELAQGLANGYDDNPRQDLIDYVWLLDKLETQIVRAGVVRIESLPLERDIYENTEEKERREAIERGELIDVKFYLKKADGSPDPGQPFEVITRSDKSVDEVLAFFGATLHRKLTEDEIKEIKRSYDVEMEQRAYRISPNRKLERGALKIWITTSTRHGGASLQRRSTTIAVLRYLK